MMPLSTIPQSVTLPTSPGPVWGLQRSEHRLLLTIGDASVAVAAVLMALWIWSLTTGFPFGASFIQRWAWWFLVAPAWVALLGPIRRVPAALSPEQTLRAVGGAAATLIVIYLAAYFYAPHASLPRLPALYFLWEGLLLTLAWRLVYLFVFTGDGFRRRALVVGSGPAAAAIVDLLCHASADVSVVAVAADGAMRADVGGFPISALADIDELVRGTGATEIVLAHDGPLAESSVQALVRWQEQGIEVVPMAAEYEHVLQRVPIAHLEPHWMFTSLPEWVRARDASRALKRLVDLVGGLLGLLALLLLTPVIAMGIVATSGRPVFYRQRRLGAGGRVFEVLKFRTMIVGAENDGPQWSSNGDPRVTAVGRWLRRSRIDELPQLLNVLRGDMSLVGPRPERPEFVEPLERAIPFYRTRLLVRPGLTGWAQVNTDYTDSVESSARKLEYDLYYIKHRSLLFDAAILWRTIGTVLGLRGR